MKTPCPTTLRSLIAFLCLLLPTLGGAEPPAESVAKPELRTVENLPIDRFDEYPAGAFPPYPWQRVGSPDAAGISLQLQMDGESAIPGNKVTGKGLVMTDTSATEGTGQGFACTFTAPPEGEVYLGFDFRLGNNGNSSGTAATPPPTPPATDTGDAMDLSCALTDAMGAGPRLKLSCAGGITLVSAAEAQAQAQPDEGKAAKVYDTIKPSVWYHLGVTLRTSGTIDFALYQAGTKDIAKTPLWRGSAPMPGTASAAHGPLVRLAFTSAGENARQGTWAVDNICMGGRVDAPRAAWLPFQQLPYADLHKAEKKVYAYYYPIYSTSHSSEDPGLNWYRLTPLNPSIAVDPKRKDAGTKVFYTPLPRPPMAPGQNREEEYVRAMEEEVRIAMQMGLDGFVLDFFAEPKDKGGEKTFNVISFALVEAAARVSPEFKIIPAIYTQAPGETIEEKDKLDPAAYAGSSVFDRLSKMPAVYRTVEGKMLFSMWAPERHSAGWWKRAMEALEAKGIPVAFMTQFNTHQYIRDFAPFTEVMAHWGPRCPGRYGWMDAARPYSKILSAPIASHDIRSRGQIYWEAANFDTLRDTWKYAIADGAQWAVLNTWSDYSEQAMAPSSVIGFSLHDLNTYYVQWFKTGKAPEITRDVLYYSYRIHHTELEPAHGRKWKLVQQYGGPDMNSRNQIELLAFLKEPGELIIRAGGEEHRRKAEAGITSFKVPLPAGKSFTPEFELVRVAGDKPAVVISGKGNHVVLDKIEYQNLLYHSGILAEAEEMKP